MLDDPETFVKENRGIKKRLGKKIVRVASRVGFLNVYSSIRSRIVQQQVAILAYHRVDKTANYPWSVTPVTPDIFELEMKYLQRKYQVISLDELCDALDDFKALPQNTAVITFDDGYRDVYVNAYPILKKYNFPATVFLVTGHIGTGNLLWYDRVRYIILETKLDKIELGDLGTYHLSSLNDRFRAGREVVSKLKKLQVKDSDEIIRKLESSSGVDVPSDLGNKVIMSWDEVKEMSRNNISFGAHTVSHPGLTRIPLEAARKEIIDSKHHIERELHRTVTTFSYPNGRPEDFNSDIQEIIKDTGFRCAVSLTPAAFVTSAARPYVLPRIHPEFTFYMFELVISGLYLDLVAIGSKSRR